MLWPTCTIHPCLTIITIECFTFTFNFYFDQSKLDNNGPSAKRPRLATTAAPSRPSDVQVSPVARRCNSSIRLLYFVSHYAYCSGTVQPRSRTLERNKVQGQSTKRLNTCSIYACAVECHAAAVRYSSAINNLLHRY